MIYFGKVDVVRKIKIAGKEKTLKIDSLGSSDIFGHHSIEGD